MFSPIKNWLASIFWYALQNLRMTRTTDRHPYETHLCFVHLHLFFYFFFCSSRVNFPELVTTSFSSRSRRSEPSILIASVVSMTSRLFCPLPYIYICELWDLVLQPKRENKQTIWKPWHSFANFLGELCRFKGTLVFFKNLTVLLSMCISKCLVYFFSPCIES